MKNIKVIIISLLAVSIILFNCGKQEVKPEEKKETEKTETVKISPAAVKEISLQTEVVSFKPFIGYISIPAKIISNQDCEAQVGSLVQGRVAKVFVKVGDHVRQGQELMLMEGLEIGEIKAKYITTKAEMDFKKANYERQKSLMDQKVGSQKSLHEAQAEFEKSYAEFNATDRKIHSIGLSDEDVLNGKSDHSVEHTSGMLSVKSPINGTVVERNVVIGQNVDGSTNAFKIVNAASVWVDGQMYEKDLNKISEKSSITFLSSSLPDDKFTGKITYIGQIIDEQTRTITIRAELNNKSNKLKIQMFGDMLVPSGANATAIIIPSEAIVKINNADFVFVQQNDTTFEKRAVTAGVTQNELTEIREGLKPNEKVVTKGAFYLKSELMKAEIGGEE